MKKCIRKPGEPRPFIQFTGDNFDDVIEFTKGNAKRSPSIGGDEKGAGHPQVYEKLTITTIHQGQQVDLVTGDYVLPEPDGIHFYPVKADIFESSFNIIEE